MIPHRQTILFSILYGFGSSRTNLVLSTRPALQKSISMVNIFTASLGRLKPHNGKINSDKHTVSGLFCLAVCMFGDALYNSGSHIPQL